MGTTTLDEGKEAPTNEEKRDMRAEAATQRLAMMEGQTPIASIIG